MGSDPEGLISYCNDNNIMFYGVSAKSGCNVNECFKNVDNVANKKKINKIN